jgi:hypothetical protein
MDTSERAWFFVIFHTRRLADVSDPDEKRRDGACTSRENCQPAYPIGDANLPGQGTI